MFLFLLILSKAEECYLDFTISYIASKYPNMFIAYSMNEGSLIIIKNETNMIEVIQADTPFNIKCYVKYNFCPFWELVVEKNVTTKSECYQHIIIGESSLPEKCNKGLTLSLSNNFTKSYNIEIVTPGNISYMINNSNPNTFSYSYFENFSVDIYLSSNEYLHGSHYLETITLNDNNITREYTDSDIPLHLYPYSISLIIDLKYYFKLGFIDKDNRVNLLRNNVSYIFEEKDPFNINLSLFSAPTCEYEKGLNLLNFTSEKNSSCVTITIDDIPNECSSDGYPDDNVQYQPNKNNSKNYPYYFVFVGKCDNYDDLIQRCRNHQVNYEFCDFALKAVGTHCHNSTTYDFHEVTGDVDKIFIATNIDHFDPLFNTLQHKTVVHIKPSYTDDPEIYFQNYNISHDLPYKEKTTLCLRYDSGKRVSYLFAEDLHIIITYGEYLNIESIYFKNCYFEGQVISKYATSDNTNIEYPSYHVFKQYTCAIKQFSNRTQYRLSYWRNVLLLEYKDYEEENYTQYNMMTFIPYPNAETYGFVFVGHYVDLNINEVNDLHIFHPINISMINFDSFSNCFLEDSTKLNNDNKYSVKITTSGNWSEVEGVKNVWFNAFQEFIDIKTDLNSHINFSKVNAYNHKPSKWVPQNYQPLKIVDKSISYYIFVVYGFERDECKQLIEEKLKCRWKECPDKNDELDYIINAKCATNESINEVLKNINEGVDKVYIENEVNNVYIDLSYLPYQVVVKISSAYYLSDLDFFKPYYSDRIAKTVTLYKGNISSKVSYLTVTNSDFKINMSPLNTHSLKLLYSRIERYSNSIETHDLIVDMKTHESLLEYKEKVFVKQYCLISPFDDDDIRYQIEISRTDWSLAYNTNRETGTYPPIPNAYIPFKYADTAGFIVHSHDFIIYESYDQTPININVSIINDTRIDLRALNYIPIDENEYNVSLNSLVLYNFKKLNLTITGYHDIINLHYNSSELDVIKDDVFKFNPHPLIIPDQNTNSTNSSVIPVKTPTPEVIEELYNKDSMMEITDVYSFNLDLDKSFNKLNDLDIEGNQVVIVNAKSFPFDKKLNSNQFIKPSPYSKINFIDGDLNLIFPDRGYVTIELNDNENVNLSLKGSGEVTFQSNKKGIIINNKADINGSFSLKLPSNVESITIDSIDLSKESSVQCLSLQSFAQPMSVNKLNADSTAKTKLYHITVNEALTIDQMAEVEFHDVNVENSKIIYNLYNYNQLNPILKGNFGKPPNSFDINLISKPDSVDKLDVISGEFDENICEKWASKIELDVDKFKAICTDVDSRSLESSQKLLYVDFNQVNDPQSPGNDDGDNPNSGNGNNKDGLPAGAIAGIVIAVIVVVAIIIIVVILIMKKKKNDKSSGSINEDNEEVQEEV